MSSFKLISISVLTITVIACRTGKADIATFKLKFLKQKKDFDLAYEKLSKEKIIQADDGKPININYLTEESQNALTKKVSLICRRYHTSAIIP